LVENSNIITAKNVHKDFGKTAAVEDVSFEVPEGSIFGFIGPSGSGKTTTIRMLTGYYRPTMGEVRVFGQAPDRFTRGERERIGYLPQLFGLYPNLTVWENMQFAASIYGMALQRKDRLLEILEFVELTKDRGKMAGKLSGGMQRRLNLAATLVHDPELIFMDEPTAGVDPVLRRKFWDHFRGLKKKGCTLFITTQYVSEAAYCDLVGVINAGEMIIVDTPSQLRYRAYGGELVSFKTGDPLDHETLLAVAELPFVLNKAQRLDDFSAQLLVVEARRDIAALLNWARKRKLKIVTVEELLPSFDDVFVELINKPGVENE
jgi:ABC-2 type transport system ATP-binding protein